MKKVSKEQLVMMEEAEKEYLAEQPVGSKRYQKSLKRLNYYNNKRRKMRSVM